MKNNEIQQLAETLYHWLKNISNDKFSVEEISSLLEDFNREHNTKLIKITENKNEIPVLLKSKKENISKRMRELAGIPHKGNFL